MPCSILSALGATQPRDKSHDAWSLLRCHFVTTTKLSKNTQPTGFPYWRNNGVYHSA